MDPVTHMLTGACMGRAGLNRKTGLATLTLVLATEAPDIDVVAYFGGSVAGLEHHRGITHSLLGAPFMAGLVVGAVYLIYQAIKGRRKENKLPPNWKLLYLYALLGSLVHLFQDFTNNYGVRPFAPFNHKWYSWDIVYIVDPIMLVAMLLGLVVPGLMALVTEEIGSTKPRLRGRGGAIFALVCLAVVILVRDFEHRRAVNALNARIYREEDPIRASAFPVAINPFFWNGVVETRNYFYMLPVRAGTGAEDLSDQMVVRFKEEETPATLAAKKSRLGRVYLDWAEYPVTTVEQLEGGRKRVQFEDLRFESVQGLTEHRRPALTGSVVLNPQLQVEEMYMGRPPENENKGDNARP